MQELREQLQNALELFRPIQQRFDGPGIERGGNERTHITPVFVKKWGEHIASLYPEVARFTVESTYTTEQLSAINDVLNLWTRWCKGVEHYPGLTQRIVTIYLQETKPYYLAALLAAIEVALHDFIATHPEQGPALQAAFQVAGSEGIRDLVRVYCAHHLEQVLDHRESSSLDMLVFTNIHQRDEADGSITQYEVWCPGADNAKVIMQQSWQAAHLLVYNHQITQALSLSEEVSRLPFDITRHLTQLVQKDVQRILKLYSLTW